MDLNYKRILEILQVKENKGIQKNLRIYILRNNEIARKILTEFAVQAVVTTSAFTEITVQERKADPAIVARILVAGTW